MTDLEIAISYIRELERGLAACHASVSLAIELVSELSTDPEVQLRVAQRVCESRARAWSDPSRIGQVRKSILLDAARVSKISELVDAKKAKTSGSVRPEKAAEPVNVHLNRAKFTVTSSPADLERGERIYRRIKDSLDLSDDAKAVLEFFADVERDTGYIGPVYVSDLELKAELALKGSVINRGIREAVAAGWLEANPVEGMAGQIYHIVKADEP